MCYKIIQQFTEPHHYHRGKDVKSSKVFIVTLREACNVLDVLEGTYQGWRLTAQKRMHETHDSKEKRLASKLLDQSVKTQFKKHKGKCGYRRIATCVQDLREIKGSDSLLHLVIVSEKTVRQSMSRQGLKVKKRRSPKPAMTERTDIADTLRNLLLTNSKVSKLLKMPIDYSPLSEEQYQALTLPNAQPLRLKATQPRQVLVSDITYLPSSMKDMPWIYLCVWQDQFTKRLLGHSLAYDQSAPSMNIALRNALNQDDLKRKYKMICHADGGKQYTGDEAKRLIARNRAVRSITRRGNTHDNAQAESLWSRLKCDLDIKRGNKRDLIFEDLSHARAVIDEYVLYYNGGRPHSSLSNQSPIIFEQSWLRANEMSKTPMLEVVPPSDYINKPSII